MRNAYIVVAVATMCAGAAVAAPNKTRVEKSRAARADAPRTESGRFDGSWTFEVRTSVGNCPISVSRIVSIKENRVSAISDASISPWGYVDSDGTIVARFAGQGGRVARAHGQLRGAVGSGAWSSSTDMCGGTWRAWRGGAEQAGW